MAQVLVAIDTSVLVAWTVAKHPFHARATPWFDAIYRGEFDAMVCAHALAELYSVLTKIPEGLSPVAARLAGRTYRTEFESYHSPSEHTAQPWTAAPSGH